jgi:phosphoglycolate phosphatase-like HAD superfamily hydrolase
VTVADGLARLNGKALVVFDLDGTLYDDETYLRAADRAIAAHLAATYGWPEADVMAALDAVLATTGRHEFLTHLVARLDLPAAPDAVVAECLEVLRTVRPALALYPWAGDLLRRLAAGGATLAVLTNGNRRQQVNKVDLLGLATVDPPMVVVYAVDHRQKPAADGLRHVLVTTGVPADGAVMIGNDAVDEGCAAACGVDYVDVADVVAALADRPPTPS